LCDAGFHEGALIPMGSRGAATGQTNGFVALSPFSGPAVLRRDLPLGRGA
jgi:hypothetical protein